jgi:hypothetical protein
LAVCRIHTHRARACCLLAGCAHRSTTTAIAVDVYATEAPEARYIGEPGMRRVAEVTLELPAGWRQSVAKRTDYDVEVGACVARIT